MRWMPLRQRVQARPPAVERTRMARVSSISGQVLELTGGVGQFEIEAFDVRSLLRALEVRYPGLGQLVDDGMAIAIDGEVHQDALDEALRADSEVVLIPRIGAG
jgi:molybdopterin synthase sulfur carrier subunit